MKNKKNKEVSKKDWEQAKINISNSQNDDRYDYEHYLSIKKEGKND